jgi:hypothetical protein
MRYFIVIGLVAATLFTGCASTIARLKGSDAELNYADYAGEPIRSFAMTWFDGWTVVGDKQLVVRTEFNKAYLLKVSGFCPDLKFANTIGLTSFAGQVDKSEKVIVGKDRCLISEIRQIDVARMKADSKAKKQQAALT